MPYPYFQNPYQYGQSYPRNQQVQHILPQNQQVQTPFVSVRSEAEARNYPVAFGTVVSFKDESSPYIYTKAMGFSQSDKPVFEKYRKEDVEPVGEAKEIPDYKEQIGNLEAQVKEMRKELDSLKERRRNNEHNGNGKSN